MKTRVVERYHPGERAFLFVVQQWVEAYMWKGCGGPAKLIPARWQDWKNPAFELPHSEGWARHSTEWFNTAELALKAARDRAVAKDPHAGTPVGETYGSEE
jgi:hypothetical protein